MAFSGGVYTLPGPALASGEIVSSSENNQFRNDVATAFNLTFLRNGTSTATANLPMGGYKLTGLGVATTSGDALSYAQAATVSTLTATGAAALNGGITVDSTAFTVADTTGNTSIAGTLAVTGATTLTGALAANGGIAVDTSAFTVADTTGNTSIAGTLAVTGATTLTGALAANGGIAVDTSAFTVADTTGNTSIAGTLAVTGVTTLTANPVLSGGTANGVAYLNGSKVLTTGSGFVFDGSNLGLGVTPSGWDGTIAGPLVFGTSAKGSLSYASGAVSLGDNFYRNSSGFRYVTTAAVSLYQASAGTHAWYTAPSGTAGSAISFTQAMTLDASGKLGIGTSSPNYKMTVNGGASATAIQLVNTASGTGAANGLLIYQDGVNCRVQNTEAGVLSFFTSNTERMRIDSSGNLIANVNGTAPTLTTNSTMSFELTNNTTLKIKVRGTDGTTRSVTLTLA